MNPPISITFLQLTLGKVSNQRELHVRITNLTGKSILLNITGATYISKQDKVQRKTTGYFSGTGFTSGDEVYPNCSVEIGLCYETLSVMMACEGDLFIINAVVTDENGKTKHAIPYQITEQDERNNIKDFGEIERRSMEVLLKKYAVTPEAGLQILTHCLNNNKYNTEFIKHLQWFINEAKKNTILS